MAEKFERPEEAQNSEYLRNLRHNLEINQKQLSVVKKSGSKEVVVALQRQVNELQAEVDRLTGVDEPEFGLVLIDSVEDATNFVKKYGFLEMSKEDRDGLGITQEAISEQGFQINGDVIYDPKKFESQTVDSDRGVDPKYKEDGWEEVGSRKLNGGLATLIRKIEEKPEK